MFISRHEYDFLVKRLERLEKKAISAACLDSKLENKTKVTLPFDSVDSELAHKRNMSYFDKLVLDEHTIDVRDAIRALYDHLGLKHEVDPAKPEQHRVVGGWKDSPVCDEPTPRTNPLFVGDVDEGSKRIMGFKLHTHGVEAIEKAIVDAAINGRGVIYMTDEGVKHVKADMFEPPEEDEVDDKVEVTGDSTFGQHAAKMYQKRVVAERIELYDRIKKLEAFLADEPDMVGEKELGRLNAQLSYMHQYLLVLDERINAFGEEHEERD